MSKNSSKRMFHVGAIIISIVVAVSFVFTHSNNPKNSINFINIIPYSIFIMALFWISISVYEDAKTRNLSPYFFAGESFVLFLGFIGMNHYMFKRKVKFRGYKKGFIIGFVINMVLAALVTVIMVLFLNNTINFLPETINDNINSTIIFLSLIPFGTSIVLGLKFLNYKDEIKDEFIVSVYPALLVINMIPFIITLLIFSCFGY